MKRQLLLVWLLVMTNLSGRALGAAPAKETTPMDIKQMWQKVDQLVNDQKYREAEDIALQIIDLAKKQKNEREWAKALTRVTMLKRGLGGYEESVAYLLNEPWQASNPAKSLLNLVAADTLFTYYQAYSWEINKREQVISGSEIDLKKWTAAQIFARAGSCFADAWTGRGSLSAFKVKDFSDFIQRNGYPDSIRSTLRDFLTYQWANFLNNTQTWSAVEQNELYKLSFEAMLGGLEATAAPAVSTPIHPLEQALVVLRDLHQSYAAREDMENLLEVQLAWLRIMQAHFTKAAQTDAIAAKLQELTKTYAGISWSTVAVFELAQRQRAADPVLAHETAAKGVHAFPNSIGGKQCYQLMKEIEAPNFSLEIMSLDGRNQRSLRLQHRNLTKLYLRAYRLDIKSLMSNERYYRFEPDWNDLPKIVHENKPVAAWEVILPDPGDYRDHYDYNTPQLTENGYYLIAASANKEFTKTSNRIDTVPFQVSPITVIRSDQESSIEFLVVKGDTGEPAPGATLECFPIYSRNRPSSTVKLTTDANGRAQFQKNANTSYDQFIALVHWGEADIFDPQAFYTNFTPAQHVSGDFIYTDRTIYRPTQKIFYKVLSYLKVQGKSAVYKAKSLHVTLHDPNGEELAAADLTTNQFGTASGEFTIPAGRLLGAYQLKSTDGNASVRVEEYKRPTFEAEITPPETELKLNQQAEIKGKAKYYFGMPVTSGTVTWRVKRRTVYPYWYWWRYFTPPDANSDYEMASGSAPVNEEGIFTLSFMPQADPGAENPQALSYTFDISADVTDDGGETRSATYQLRLGYCAVSADIGIEGSYFEAGQPATLTITRQDLNGQPRPGEGDYEVFALEQPEQTQSASELPALAADKQKTTPGDLLQPRWVREPGIAQRMFAWKDGKSIAKGKVTHTDQGKGEVELKTLPAGAYRVYYHTADSFGVKFETRKEFLSLAPETKLNVPLVLFADKTVYHVGDQAEFMLGAGYAKQKIWWELARDQKVVKREQVTAAGVVKITLPVDESLRGGFSLRVYGLHDYQLLDLTQAVMVPYDNKELKLDFMTFRDRLRPGQKETWQVKVRGPQSERVAAELLAYMYDRSLDFFAPHQYPSLAVLYPQFFGAPSLVCAINEKSGYNILNQGWYETPGAPSYSADALISYGNYGIGGPGGRPGRMRFMRSAAMPMAAPPAPGEPAQSVAVTSGDLEVQAEGAVYGRALGGIVNGVAEEKAADKPKAKKDEEPPPPPPAAPQLQMRSDFSETAFFLPHLLTDADGTATISFTAPDSVTSWKLYIHAMTQDLKYAVAEKQVETRKELMVRPYMPRFLREGDDAELRVVVNNAGEVDLAGDVTLTIIDRDTEQDITAQFQPKAAALPFSAKAGQSGTVTFAVKAPSHLGSYAFKVIAQTKELADGEQRPLPVLPGRMHLTQSKFVTLKDNAHRVLRLPDLATASEDASLINESLIVSVDGQLIYHVLRALPYLVNFPYECVEQTLNRFLSAGIVATLYKNYPAIAKAAEAFSTRDTPLEQWNAEDPNRSMALVETPWLTEAKGGKTDFPLINILNPKIASVNQKSALTKLEKAQLGNGAFPWWSGGQASPYMTLYILYGLAKAEEFGMDTPKNVANKACKYLGDHYRDYYAKRMKKEDFGDEFLVFLNYTLSCFPDKNFYKAGFSDAERQDILAYTFKHWRDISPYLKAELALTLNRMNRNQDARLLLSSIMDSSITKEDQGTFWAPEDRGWLWYNDNIESHAMILRAVMEISPDDSRKDGLVLWLFLNKKMNQWKSTRTTAEVLYSLVHYLQAEGALAVREEATVTLGDVKQTFVFQPDEYAEGTNRLVLTGAQVDPPHMAEATVEKSGKGFMFASMNWHYSTEKLPAEARGDFLGVTRSFFLRVNEGGKMVLKPLAEGATVSVGDEVEVQLSITSKHPMEYVQLQDPRAAGFEPENQISRHRYDLGIVWYEEVRDSATNFFFESLPQGEYTFKYRIRAAMAGHFKTAPATLQSMYAPEFAAFSSGEYLTIQP